MTDEVTIERLKELAGIKQQKNKCLVLLPAACQIDELRNLLDKLKEIDGDKSNWTKIIIDGTEYIATGVVVELP